MRRVLKCLSALLFFGLLWASPTPVVAQQVYVVATCGAQTFNLGSSFWFTELQNGNLCVNPGSPSSPGVVTVGPTSNAALGIVPVVVGPAAASEVAKASPGNFYGFTLTPTSAVYVFLINATSLPANATLTPGIASGNLQECLGLAPANLTSTFDFGSGPPEPFSTGITIALSSTACPVLTASAVGTINGRAQ